MSDRYHVPAKRTPLQEVILANFHPPRYAGGSWTINPEDMEKAVRAHIAAEDYTRPRLLTTAEAGFVAMMVNDIRLGFGDGKGTLYEVAVRLIDGLGLIVPPLIED